jgi:NADP-dependent 3-hydroxy acid dehydrogenase YdfG
MTSKSIFITGAASGIGAATARLFAEKGWRVGVADLQDEATRAVVHDTSGQAQPFCIDVSDHNQVAVALKQFCALSAGRLDALFNSAGILDMRRFDQTPLDRLHAIIDVNFKGVVNSIQAALPYLKSTHASHVITMGSTSGIYGAPDLAVYSATKFAVRGLTEALNIELEADGIWVSDIMVSYVSSPMVVSATHTAKSVEILGVRVTPDMVAQTVLQAVNGRQVHWFVTENDATIGHQVDATPWEARRNIMKSLTGY